MQKQKLFDFSSMPKMVLIITIVVMLGSLFGAVSYLLKMSKIDLPIIPLINKTQCEIDSDCYLVYVSDKDYVCQPCDRSSEKYQCLTVGEMKKLKNKGNKIDESVLCSPCSPEVDRYICKCENGKCEKVKIEEVEEMVITTDKMEYEIGEEVEITIENNTDKEQEMGYLLYITERLENNNWVGIKQAGCQCVVNCNVAKLLPIKLNNKTEHKWNQKESWCNDLEFLTYPEVISFQVPIGKYRIKSIEIGFPDPENYNTIYSNEFTIKEKVAVDTSDWQTYRNEEFGFEIEYPENWIVSRQMSKIHLLAVSFGMESDETMNNTNSRNPIFNIYLFSKEAWEETQSWGEKYKAEKVKEDDKGNIIAYRINRNGYSEIIDQILSTFKFIEK